MSTSARHAIPTLPEDILPRIVRQTLPARAVCTEWKAAFDVLVRVRGIRFDCGGVRECGSLNKLRPYNPRLKIDARLRVERATNGQYSLHISFERVLVDYSTIHNCDAKHYLTISTSTGEATTTFQTEDLLDNRRPLSAPRRLASGRCFDSIAVKSTRVSLRPLTCLSGVTERGIRRTVDSFERCGTYYRVVMHNGFGNARQHTYYALCLQSFMRNFPSEKPLDAQPVVKDAARVVSGWIRLLKRIA